MSISLSAFLLHTGASGPAAGATFLLIGVIVGAGIVLGTFYAAGSLTPRTSTSTKTQTLTTTVTTTVSSGSSGAVLDDSIGQPVSQLVYSYLYQTSNAQYGASNSTYLTYVGNLTGPLFSTDGKPILIYVGAEYCLYCAGQRWPLVMALMRFGNFTNLEYMASAAGEGDFATFTFINSSYQSDYVAFQPYEIYDRGGNPLATLPANYTSTWQQHGKSSVPFLDFANEYFILGASLNPTMLGTKNWTQIISSIQTGGTLETHIKQAANLITAVICKTTGNVPASVCSQASITALTDSLVSYTPPSASSGSELLLPDAAFESASMPQLGVEPSSSGAARNDKALTCANT